MTTDTPDTTVLRLYGIGVPPYSARGLTESLAHIDEAVQLERDVNGTLVDVSDPNFRKLAITISGTDQQPPACDGLWPGREITVECIEEFAFATDTDGPSHEVVPGSLREEGDFTFYRPLLHIIVTGWQISKAEYPADVTWQLSGEEV